MKLLDEPLHSIAIILSSFLLCILWIWMFFRIRKESKTWTKFKKLIIWFLWGVGFLCVICSNYYQFKILFF